ncbi:MAG: HAD-IC family P-type ATPase [Hyphomicrobiales bacterium]
MCHRTPVRHRDCARARRLLRPSRVTRAADPSGRRRHGARHRYRRASRPWRRGSLSGGRARLGRRAWVAEIAEDMSDSDRSGGLAFAVEGGPLLAVELGEHVRDGAAAAIEALHNAGIGTRIVSGDAAAQVARLADRLDVTEWHADQSPADKIARIEALRAEGKKVLFVGDGINDAPALAAGHVSMAPASGSDVGRTAADFVFTRDSLEAVTAARGIALRAQALVKQNFGLAFAYNVIAVPIAMAGMVTPLVAAIAMSASSIVVVLNSMRLTRGDPAPAANRPARSALAVGTGSMEAAE